MRIREIVNLAELVDLSDLAAERLFQANLDVSLLVIIWIVGYYDPKRILSKLISLDDVAALCGFKSTPHFSKCYRDHFGYLLEWNEKSILSQSQRISVNTEDSLANPNLLVLSQFLDQLTMI